MNRFLRVLLPTGALGALLAFAVSWQTPTLHGQTAITRTTSAAAMTRTGTQITLTLSTGVTAPGTFLYIDGELLQTQSEVGTTNTWNVRRGVSDGQTPATAHASGTTVWVMGTGGPGQSFFTYDVKGGCSLTDYAYQPFINTKAGHIFECFQGLWLGRYDDPVRPLDFTVQDNFDGGYTVMQDDGTVKSLTDAEENFVYGSPLGAIEYREEQTKTASTWTTINGYLDVSGDNTTTAEGVEIIWGASSDVSLNQWLEAGTQGGCISASITVLDISGTNQVLIGFRNNAAFVDAAAYDTYTVWSALGITDTSGSIMSKEEVSGSTLTDDTAVDWADAETRALRVCVTKAGVPSAYFSAAYTTSQVVNDIITWIPIPMTNSGVAYTAGTGMIPYFSFLTSGTDGPDVRINWVRLTRLP